MKFVVADLIYAAAVVCAFTLGGPTQILLGLLLLGAVLIGGRARARRAHRGFPRTHRRVAAG
jgi:hypothetical protein